MENSGFFDKKLLETNYFKQYNRAYEKYQETRDPIWYNTNRNYQKLVDIFGAIYDFNKQHAGSFSKRVKAQDNDWKSCEAIYTEILVYYFYLKLYYEEIVKSIQLHGSECDLIVERSDNTKMYMEIFCVMPDFPAGEPGNSIVYDVKTHTQKSLSSIR